MLPDQIRERIQGWMEARRARSITVEAARQRAALGAAYLDEIFPYWYRHVDPFRLDLGNGRVCILGQLYGSYSQGLTRSRVVDPSSAPRANLSPAHFGLAAIHGVCEALQEQDYENLNQAWQQEIDRRKEAARRLVMPPFVELSVREPVALN